MKIKPLLNIIGLWALAALAGGGVRYQVTDLSELAADSDIVPAMGYCINDSGDVAGHGTPTAEDSKSKPFLYDAATGTFINLGNLAGSFTTGNGGNGYGLNNAGQVVGRNCLTGESWDYRAFLFIDHNADTLVDSNDMMNLTVESDYLDYKGSAEAINNEGQVVGFYYESSSSKDPHYGWIWTDLNGNNQPDVGEKEFLGQYTPQAINDAGDIALYYDVDDDGNDDAFLWCDSNADGAYDADELQRMPLPQTLQSMSPRTINRSKAVCGIGDNSNGKSNGFYWQDDNADGVVDTEEYSVFGTSGEQTYVRAMNNISQVVGGTFDYKYQFSSKSNRSAFIWTLSEGMVNLNDLADSSDDNASPRWLTQAEGINNCGQIVAYGYYDLNESGSRNSSTESEHVFVLTPYLQGDISGDGRVDLIDVSLLSQYFLQSAEACPEADIDDSGTIDSGDLIYVAEDWLVDLNTV